jgi:hypothetical protein
VDDSASVEVTEPSVDGSEGRKKRWSDLSSRQRIAIVLGAIAELIVTTIALRDLVRRPARQVRGRKPLWVLTFVVQPFGPILYLLISRRRRPH